VATTSTSGSTNATTRATVGVLVVLGLLLVIALMSGGASSRVGPATADLPAGRTAVELPLEPADTAAVRVPSIGVDTRRLLELGLKEDKSLQVPPDATTVGHYSGAAAPGERGPAIYASHVNYRGVDGGFAHLKDVEAGDQVLIDRADGVTVVYTVERVDEVSKNAFPTMAVYGPTVGPEIRLITCGGDFDSDVRSYEDNIVVFGRATEAYRT
jgi:Sortase domain